MSAPEHRQCQASAPLMLFAGAEGLFLLCKCVWDRRRAGRQEGRAGRGAGGFAGGITRHAASLSSQLPFPFITAEIFSSSASASLN